MRNENSRIAVLGGDRRQEILTELLLADGKNVDLILGADDLPRLSRAELVVFPTPMLRPDSTVGNTGIPAEEIFRFLPRGSIAAGGRVTDSCRALAAERDVALLDYTAREEFAVSNALATAEAALALALTELPTTLQGSACLVAGAGRIGMLLARRLALLGAEVTVSARSARDLARIAADGLRPVRTADLAAHVGAFDLLYNTVPAVVFTREVLAVMRPTALLYDLASAPGGVDWHAAKELGRQARAELSLPARYAPCSAAAYLRDSLMQIWEEQH